MRGEIGRFQSVLYERNVGRFSSFPELVKKISRDFGITEDLENWGTMDGEVGRIDIQMLVDENNYEITQKDRKYKEWKQGSIKLWNAYIILDIEFIKAYKPDADEISSLSGIQII